MADKENLKISIDVVGNYKQAIDEYNNALKKLQDSIGNLNKSGKLQFMNMKEYRNIKGQVNDIGVAIEDAASKGKNLFSIKGLKDTIKYLKDVAKEAQSVANGLDVVTNHNFGGRKKVLSNNVSLKGLERDEKDLQTIQKLLDGISAKIDSVAAKSVEVPVKAKVDKKSVDSAKKEVEKTLEDTAKKSKPKKSQKIEEPKKVKVEPVIDEKALNDVKKKIEKETTVKAKIEPVVTKESPKPKKEEASIKVSSKQRDGAESLKETIKASLDEKFLNKSFVDLLSKLNEKPFHIKVGKDETFFKKNIDDNIKKINAKPLTIKIGKDENYFIKSIRDNIKNVNRLGLSIKLDGKIDDKALAKQKTSAPSVVVELSTNAKDLLRAISKEVRAINAQIGLDGKPSINIPIVASAKGFLKSVKSAIANANLGDLAINVPVRAISKGLNKSVKDAIRDISDTTIKLDAKVKGTKEVGSDTTRQNNVRVGKEEQKEYESLLAKRNAAYDKMEQAYQKYGDTSVQFRQARKGYHTAQTDLLDFHTAAGAGGGLRSLEAELSKQLSLYADGGKMAKAIGDELQKVRTAMASQQNIDNKYNPAYQAKVADANAKFDQRMEATLGKFNDDFRKSVIDLANALDKHNTQLLEMQRKAELNNIKAQAQEEVAAQKLLNARNKQIEDEAKQAAAWNRAERQRDSINQKRDIAELKDGLKVQVQNPQDIAKFMADLEKYRTMTGNTSPNFYQNMARQLGIDNKHPFAEALKQQQAAYKNAFDWSANEKNNAQIMQNAKNIRNQYQTLAAEARKYAQQAEMAWRNAGNKPSEEFNRFAQSYANQMEKIMRFGRDLGSTSYSKDINILSNLARSMQQGTPIYDQTIARIKQMKDEQDAFRRATESAAQAERRLAREAREAARAQRQQQQQPLNRSAGVSNGEGFFGALGGFAAYLTRFLGRSDKGFGSFLEAVSDASSRLMRFGGTLGVAGGIVAGIAAVVSGVVVSLTSLVSTAQFLGNALMQIGQTIYNVLRPGIELYQQQQSAIFSFTAALQSNGVLPNGTALRDMSEGRDIARGLSKDLITQAMIDAELSAFSLKDLLSSLQGTLPMLMQRGMSAEQAYEVNKGVAGVAKMTQLSANQILQETRDLAQGSITARTSQVANALGITNEDLAQYQGNADALFEYLMQKFKNYGEMLQEYEDTAVGRFQQLEERWQTTAKTIVEDIAPSFKGVFEMLIDMTGRWVDANGNYLNAMTGQWEDALGNVWDKDAQKWKNSAGELFDKVDVNGNAIIGGQGAEFQLSDELEKAKDILIEIIEYIATAVDGFIEWARETFGIVDPLEAANDIIKSMIDGFFICIGLVGEFAAWLYENRDGLFSIGKVIVWIIALLGDMVLAAKVVVDTAELILDAFISVAEAIGKCEIALAKLASGDVSGAVETMNSLEKGVKKRFSDSLEDWGRDVMNMSKLSNDFVLGQGSVMQSNTVQKFIENIGMRHSNGKLLDAVTRYKGQVVDGSDKGDSRGKQLSDVRGTQKENEKANKQAIKDSQKMLKEQLSALKESLKDALADLKDILSKNKIAYDEGFMGVKEYFDKKAQIEAEEARLKLEEVLAERELLSTAQFENEYDRQKELNRVNREIRQYNRELGNAQTAIKEINRAWKEGVQQLSTFTAALKSLGNGKLNQHQVKGIVDSYFGVANSGQGAMQVRVDGLQEVLENYASEHGIEPWIADEVLNQSLKYGEESAKLAKLTLAMMTQESGGNQNAVSPVGAVGLMQLMPDTAVSLGVNPYDWRGNIAGGMKYIKQMLDAFGGDTNKAIAAYNAGPQAVEDYGGVPPYAETENHVRIVGGYFNQLEEATKNLTTVMVEAADATQTATSNIEGIADVVNSASGETIGYTPSESYSRGGLDTRYMTFQEGMSTGVDNQIAGMQEDAKKAFNLFARLIAERGVMADVSSISGGVHETGGWSHAAGWKLDFSTKEDLTDAMIDVIREVGNMIGLGIGLEDRGSDNEHFDVSFGSGGVGGEVITALTGDAFYQKLQGAVTSGVREGGLGYFAGMDFQTQPDTTGTSQAFNDALKKVRADIFNELKDYEGKILDIYNPDPLQNIFATITLIKQKYDQRLHKLEQDIIKYQDVNPELKEFAQRAYDALRTNMEVEIQDTMNSIYKRRLNFSMSNFETWGKYQSVESFRGNDVGQTEFIKNYFAQIYKDASNPLAVANSMKPMWEQVIEYTKLGAVEAAQQLRDFLLEQTQKMNNIFQQNLQQHADYFNNYRTWLSNSDATNLQKEFGEREITARENEVRSNLLAQQIELNESVIQQYTNDLEALIKRIEELRKISKDLTKTEKERGDATREADGLQGKAESIMLQRQQLDLANEQLKIQRMQADQLKHQPELLRDLRQESKQALEDGLVTFLTDGITQANSLGEALRNMLVDFLKTMQQFFAKRIVTSLMNQWFPQINEVDQSGNKVDPYANLTGYTRRFGGVNQNINPTQTFNQTALTTTQTPTLMTNNALGAFSQPWQNSPLNPQAQQQNPYSFEQWKQSIDKMGTSMDTTSQKFNLLGTNTDFVSESVDSASKALTNVQETVKPPEDTTALTTLTTDASMAAANVQTLSQSFSTLTQNTITLGNAMSRIGMSSGLGGYAKGGIVHAAKGAVFHNNGVITGAGTSTSDSIPAMLSNGEAVINAKAVKELGVNFITAVNSGAFTKIKAKIPHFAQGGTVGEAQQGTARGITDFAKQLGTEVSTTNNMNVALVKDFDESMEFFMRSPQGQRILLDFQKGNGRALARFKS